MDWAQSVDLSEPIDVSVNQQGEYELEDGHHRWFAAQKTGRDIKAKIEIKGKPIEVLLGRQEKGDTLKFQREDAPTEGAPTDKVRVRLNRRFDEARQGVRGDIEKIGRDVFGENFKVELAESITTPEGDAATGAFDPESRIAYIAMRADQEGMTGTLAHEGIHYLRTAGAFSNADGTATQAWQILEDQAGKWRKDYGIDARYEGDVGGKDDAQRESLMNEEAIAEAFADFQTRGTWRPDFGLKVRAALNKVKRFFRRAWPAA